MANALTYVWSRRNARSSMVFMVSDPGVACIVTRPQVDCAQADAAAAGRTAAAQRIQKLRRECKEKESPET